MSVVLVAFVSGIGVCWVPQALVSTPLQQSTCRRTSAAAWLVRSRFKRVATACSLMESRRGSRLAIDEEGGAGLDAYRRGQLCAVRARAPSRQRTARVAGSRDESPPAAYGPGGLDLPKPIVFDLARPSLITVFVVLMVGLLIAIPKDVQWSQSRRHGRRLKGPELVSIRQFNRRTRANGISFMQTLRRFAKLLGLQPGLAIPRAIESSHLLIMGASGTGRSALIRQILSQLEDRGDTAILYDRRSSTRQFSRYVSIWPPSPGSSRARVQPSAPGHRRGCWFKAFNSSG